MQQGCICTVKIFYLVADHNQSYISHVIKDTSVLPAARKMLQNNINFRHQGVIVQVNFMTKIHRRPGWTSKNKTKQTMVYKKRKSINSVWQNNIPGIISKSQLIYSCHYTSWKTGSAWLCQQFYMVVQM